MMTHKRICSREGKPRHFANLTVLLLGALLTCPGWMERASADIPTPYPPRAYCYGSGTCCWAYSNRPPCCQDVLPQVSAPGDDLKVAGVAAATAEGALLTCAFQGYVKCAGIRACCFPDASCSDVDALCCNDLGGIAGEVGSNCTPNTCGACCAGPSSPFTCTVKTQGSCAGTATAFTATGTLCGGTTCTATYTCCNPGPTPDHPIPTPSRCDNHPVSVCDAEGGTPYFNSSCEDFPSSDGDPVRDKCDNCNPGNPDHHCENPGVCNNPDQANADGDPFGNTCDYCPSTASSTNVDDDGDGEQGVGLGNGCDNCPMNNNPDQENCDSWRGDPDGDLCDDDIDGDDVYNDDDVCDFSPQNTPIIDQAGHPLWGTVVYDVDGDCDVDYDDYFGVIFNQTLEGCESGTPHITYPTCP